VNADTPCRNSRLICTGHNASDFQKFSCKRHSIFQPRHIQSHWTVWITELETFYVENKFVGDSCISFTCPWPLRPEIPNLELAASHVITYGYLNPDEGKMYMASQLWKLHEKLYKNGGRIVDC
jgi:hypothetical protein